MAGTLITNLTNKVTMAGTEEIPLNDAGSDKKVTVANLHTNAALVTPVVTNGLTASGGGSIDFSNSAGAFQTSSGANTLNGAVTLNAASTPSLTTAPAKANTGFLMVSGKTNGSLKITTADATLQAVTVTAAPQIGGASTLTIPDQGAVSRAFVFDTLAQTLTNKTLTAPVINSAVVTSPVLTNAVINGATSTTGDFDLSGSGGLFKTTTGFNSMMGAVYLNANFPLLETASGKANTGYLKINGKLNGSLTITTPDATGGNLTISAVTQGGTPTASLPDMLGTSRAFVMDTLAQTVSNKSLTAILGATASSTADIVFSGSNGNFATTTGPNFLSGPVTVNASPTPSLTTAAGKTNTGFLTVSGKTSGTLKITTDDSTAQNVTVTAAPQTSADATVTIPDQVGGTRAFVFDTLTQTLTNKTVSGPSASFTGTVTVASGTGTTAGGSTAGSFKLGTTGIGIYFGSGSPTITATQGSIYLRTDGSATTNRMYINLTGAATWTNVTTGS